ncbi:hypothetical protein DL546_004514 [Coniochaeta pulveracea]|uniref:Deacetylase sirtuin-type domain-containing protein n=1 Tax=Coniochaeta pulveracea TaxID=177199 RepID=A0A420Y3E9_9PEZI|nr:hypothetical protein DL546_004514 [Coniochaeta pulveracea]
MPTIHVTPESGDQLQEIANALAKAKKVVVVTGAGISTNSGIPDFRSENGLYSLIQAQFDNASKEADKMGQEEEVEAAMRSSPPILDVIECVEEIDERPKKRRKLSINKWWSTRASNPFQGSQ